MGGGAMGRVGRGAMGRVGREVVRQKWGEGPWVG